MVDHRFLQMTLGIAMALTVNAERQSKHDIPPIPVNNDLRDTRSLLHDFFKLTAQQPLTPQRRSNFNSRPLGHRLNDRTEYAINKNILSDVFESDMLLTVPQMNDVIAQFERRINGTAKDRRRRKRKTIDGNSFRWPNNTVYYTLNANDTKWQQMIRDAMAKWQSETCIRFVENGTVRDHVYFFRGAGCYSSVGRIGGRQYASIGYGCESRGIIAHEIGHALGFWHEQSRPDRDKYVNINEDHIFKGTIGNFEKRNDIIRDAEIPYDFGSVMHYGPQAFTDDWKYVTVETKDHRYQHTIGQRQELSFIDIKEANRLYCNDTCTVPLQCRNGGYEDPLHCAKCKCPPGLDGLRCETLPSSEANCGGELLALDVWQTLTNAVVGKCYWRITAAGLTDGGNRVHFEVIDTNFECDSSCSENYLEIKHNSDFQQTGFRQCCNAAPGSVTSDNSTILIISNTVRRPANFTLRYIRAEFNKTRIPKPPPGPWNGGGLTSLFGQETGVDSTWERYVVNELPRIIPKVLPRSGGDLFRSADPIARLVSDLFLRGGG